MSQGTNPIWYAQSDRMPARDTWVIVAMVGGRVTSMKYSPAKHAGQNAEKCWKVHGQRYLRSEVAFWMPLPPHPTAATSQDD